MPTRIHVKTREAKDQILELNSRRGAFTFEDHSTSQPSSGLIMHRPDGKETQIIKSTLPAIELQRRIEQERSDLNQQLLAKLEHNETHALSLSDSNGNAYQLDVQHLTNFELLRAAHPDIEERIEASNYLSWLDLENFLNSSDIPTHMIVCVSEFLLLRGSYEYDMSTSERKEFGRKANQLAKKHRLSREDINPIMFLMKRIMESWTQAVEKFQRSPQH